MFKGIAGGGAPGSQSQRAAEFRRVGACKSDAPLALASKFNDSLEELVQVATEAEVRNAFKSR